MDNKRKRYLFVDIPFGYFVAGVILGLGSIVIVILLNFIPGFFRPGFLRDAWKISIIGFPIAMGIMGFLYGLKKYFIERK
jgi:hypothetical protein